MNRFGAVLLHFLLSALVLGGVLLLVTIFLYPDFYFRVERAGQMMKVLTLVVIALGPFATAIIFKPGKPGLKMDMCILAGLQVAAVLFGLCVLYQHRPLYLVSTGSQFRVVVASEIDLHSLTDPALQVGLSDAPKLVYADANEQDRQDILWEALGGGKDLDVRPQYYEPIDGHLEMIRDRAIPLTRDILDDQESAELEAFLSRQQGTLDDFLYYHVKARGHFYLAAFSKSDFELKDILAIDAEEI